MNRSSPGSHTATLKVRRDRNAKSQRGWRSSAFPFPVRYLLLQTGDSLLEQADLPLGLGDRSAILHLTQTLGADALG
jgi:hypothetical protein